MSNVHVMCYRFDIFRNLKNPKILNLSLVYFMLNYKYKLGKAARLNFGEVQMMWVMLLQYLILLQREEIMRDHSIPELDLL